MKIRQLKQQFAVCKLEQTPNLETLGEFLFFAKTKTEISLVCEQRLAPICEKKEEGWTAFMIVGTLDFSLVGIISKISSLLAENSISVFVVSTYQTDYFLVRTKNAPKTVSVLAKAGYELE